MQPEVPGASTGGANAAAADRAAANAAAPTADAFLLAEFELEGSFMSACEDVEESDCTAVTSLASSL